MACQRMSQTWSMMMILRSMIPLRYAFISPEIHINPSNAETTFIQSTMPQKKLKTI